MVIAALHKMKHCLSVVCLVIRVLSIIRIFLGYPYFMAINSVNKTVVGYSSPPEQARLHCKRVVNEIAYRLSFLF